MNQARLHAENMEDVRSRLESAIYNSSVDVWYDGEDCFFDVTQRNETTGNESKWSFCVDFGTGKVQMLEPTFDVEYFGSDNEIFGIIKNFLNGGMSREKRFGNKIGSSKKLIKSGIYDEIIAESENGDYYIAKDNHTRDYYLVWNGTVDRAVSFDSPYRDSVLKDWKELYKMHEFNIKSSIEEGLPKNCTPIKNSRKSIKSALTQKQKSYVLNYLKENSFFPCDNGKYFYFIVPTDDKHIKMTPGFKKQLKDEGLYGNSFIGGMTDKAELPIDMKWLPIYGDTDRWVTKWFTYSYDSCFDRDLRDRGRGLSKRLDFNNINSSKKSIKSSKYIVEVGDDSVEFDNIEEANETFRQAVENNDSNTSIKIYVDEGYSNRHLKLMDSERGRLNSSRKLVKSSLFYIAYYGDLGDGYVGYDNEPTNDFGQAMTFNSREEAEHRRYELQREWGSNLQVEEFDDSNE